MTCSSIPSSFRDPSGFLFWHEGAVYRQINKAYRDNYDGLMSSGLYAKLVDSELLVGHEEVELACPKPESAYKVIKPEQLKFISYPYEWCFSQLKDAALTTLEIQKVCLDYGMSLKDCSAYNIQFAKGKPLFIDTLSFESYEEGRPWVAYRQFCQHFLAPLALMSFTDIRLNQLFRTNIDGVPLDLAASLLPLQTKLRFSLLSHIHLHARSQKHYADKAVATNNHRMSSLALRGMIDNLESAVRKLSWLPKGTEWADYYEDTNYSSRALEHKKRLVVDYVEEVQPRSLWDLGANIGVFSRIASQKGIPTLSFDIDPASVEKNYLKCNKEKETRILPLLLDLTNPSPSIGWNSRERMSLLERGPVDSVLALALIHHLAISNNLPFSMIADFFGQICTSLIIEFVPKSDSQIQRLLQSREDIFPNYTLDSFVAEFEKYYRIARSEQIEDSERTLFLMIRS
jgi:hypothetical protein